MRIKYYDIIGRELEPRPVIRELDAMEIATEAIADLTNLEYEELRQSNKPEDRAVIKMYWNMLKICFGAKEDE